MEKEKPGRKEDFPGVSSGRLSIRLPKETIIELEIFAVTSPLTRNQIINEALIEYLREKNQK